MDKLVYFRPQKWQKMTRFSTEKLQILEIFSIFQIFSKKIRGEGGQNNNSLSAKKVAQESKNAQYYRRDLIRRKIYQKIRFYKNWS